MVYCQNCGAQIPDQAAFCTKCGGSAVSQPGTRENAKITAVAKPKKAKGWKVVFAIVCSLLVAFGAFVIYNIAPIFQDKCNDPEWLVGEILLISAAFIPGVLGFVFLGNKISYKVLPIAIAFIFLVWIVAYYPFVCDFAEPGVFALFVTALGFLLVFTVPLVLYLLSGYFISRTRKNA